jgi:hypothetical protein
LFTTSLPGDESHLGRVLVFVVATEKRGKKQKKENTPYLILSYIHEL